MIFPVTLNYFKNTELTKKENISIESCNVLLLIILRWPEFVFRMLFTSLLEGHAHLLFSAKIFFLWSQSLGIPGVSCFTTV